MKKTLISLMALLFFCFSSYAYQNPTADHKTKTDSSKSDFSIFYEYERPLNQNVYHIGGINASGTFKRAKKQILNLAKKYNADALVDFRCTDLGNVSSQIPIYGSLWISYSVPMNFCEATAVSYKDLDDYVTNVKLSAKVQPLKQVTKMPDFDKEFIAVLYGPENTYWKYKSAVPLGVVNLMKAGKFNNAYLQLKRYAGKGNSYVLQAIGDSLRLDGNYAEATQYYKRSLVQDRGNVGSYRGLLLAYMKQDMPLKASEIAHQISILKKEDANAHLGYAWVTAALGMKILPFEELKKALAINQKCARAYFLIGLLYYSFQNDGPAIIALAEAVRLEPDIQNWINDLITAKTLKKSRLGLR